MAHRPGCPCPACRYRRGEGSGQAPQLSIRVVPEVREYLLSHPEGARATVERLVMADQAAGAGPSRQELLRECEALRQKLKKAEGYRNAHQLLKSIVSDREQANRQLAEELHQARATLKLARHGLMKFAIREPGDIFAENPEAIAVVARATLQEMDACLAAEPIPRARRKRRA